MADTDESVRQFMGITGVDEERARFYLESSAGELEVRMSWGPRCGFYVVFLLLAGGGEVLRERRGRGGRGPRDAAVDATGGGGGEPREGGGAAPGQAQAEEADAQVRHAGHAEQVER